MAGYGVKVDGARQLRAALKKANGDLDDLKDANAAAARLVATASLPRAPRVSGRLASTVRGNRAAGRATVTAGRAGVPYALPIHYGWPARGIEAQPFVLDAARATEPQWLALYTADVQNALDRAATASRTP